MLTPEDKERSGWGSNSRGCGMSGGRGEGVAAQAGRIAIAQITRARKGFEDLGIHPYSFVYRRKSSRRGSGNV